ncbi:MAG: hypothetical protein V1663_03365 [archaeon]
MKRKYPNKKKRKGFWKRYEQAQIKDYRKVWDTAMSFIAEKSIPFTFSKIGRKPNLTRKEYVCMSITYVYFDLDFRELEYLIELLTQKRLDHTNCVRWFGKLDLNYINDIVFSIHKKIIGIEDVGDYITDSTKATCDRLKITNDGGKDTYYHITWKLHVIIQYIFTLGVISVISLWSTNGERSESPILRNKLLNKKKLQKSRKLHADKGYFGKENIKKCRELNLIPNIVPKDQIYTDPYIKKYIRKDYDNESRKNNRGLVEGLFGGFQTETDMKIRCRKNKHRNIYLGLLGVKHNLRSYLRATALSIIRLFRTNPS